MEPVSKLRAATESFKRGFRSLSGGPEKLVWPDGRHNRPDDGYQKRVLGYNTGLPVDD